MNRTSLLNSGLLISGAAALLMGAPLLPAMAQNSTTQPAISADATTNMGVSAVDAGNLIGKDVVGADGKTVGEIESVMVGARGKVTSVVLNVGSWLETDKRISVSWNDLKADTDGTIHTSLTKEGAKAAAGYAYKDESLRGKVLNDAGQLYDKATASVDSATPNNASMSLSTPAQNGDGSFNASKVVGMSVMNQNNEDIGEIGEILLDRSGKVDGVVVDVGGFLGIGAHPVKLGWNQVKLEKQDGSFRAVVNMDKSALKKMPEYDETS